MSYFAISASVTCKRIVLRRAGRPEAATIRLDVATLIFHPTPFSATGKDDDVGSADHVGADDHTITVSGESATLSGEYGLGLRCCPHVARVAKKRRDASAQWVYFPNSFSPRITWEMTSWNAMEDKDRTAVADGREDSKPVAPIV